VATADPPSDDDAAPPPAIRPSELAAAAESPPPPRRSGSIDVVVGDSDPALPPVRRRATTASVITGHVVHAADRVVQAAESVGGKIGDVVGESLSHIPGVPKTRRGRVLARSIVVSFCLVFSWIAVIVGLQLRGRRPPDFRPQASTALTELRAGHFHQVYMNSSERFQEVVLEDTFTAQMTDMNRTLGNFREINSVIATETNRGPGGRTGRVDLRLEFERADTNGSISFRWEDEQWKLLGLSVEVPEALLSVVGTEAARRDRVAGDAVMLSALVTTILTHAATGQVDQIWNESAPGFQQSISLETLRRTEAEHRRALGNFRRVLNVTSARINPSQTGTGVDLLLEFDNGTITGSFEFTKIAGVWRMTFYKLVLPLPRVPG
jgi:Protein of unknown function (DUF4019)